MRSPSWLIARLLGREPWPRVHAALCESYRRTFSEQHGEMVLGDLARYCHGYMTTSEQAPDPVTMAMLEGRRQVFLRILAYTEIAPDEVLQFAAKQQRRSEHAQQEDSQ